MKKIHLALIAATLSLISFAAGAQTTVDWTTIPALRKSLAQARAPQDSIKILWDIFDGELTRNKVAAAKQLLRLARQQRDVDMQLDVLRHLSATYTKDKDLAQVEREVARIPVSGKQRETLLFVKMRRISYLSRRLSEKEKQKEIVKILAAYDDENPKDKYTQLLNLYTLMAYLRNSSSEEMLEDYVERMTKMVESSSFELNALKDIVYSEAANIYSDAELYAKAVDANQKLLSVIDKLEQHYAKLGRKYRNYDISRYVCYRRMLRNADALKPEEVDMYYQKCVALAKENRDVRVDMEQLPFFYSLYYVAKKDYAKAIPYLKQKLERKDIAMPVRKQTLNRLVKAAEATGDDATLLQSLKEYNRILEEQNNLKAEERYRELQIKYDVQDLKNRNINLVNENREDVIRSQRAIMTFVSVAFVIMFVILIFCLYNWSKTKRNTNRMGRVVDNIRHERRRLHESIYHDYPDEKDPLALEEEYDKETWQKRLRKAGVRNGNSSIFMTESMISDILFIATFGHADIKKHIAEVSVCDIMRRAEAAGIKDAGTGIEIMLKYPEEDFRIETDIECLSDFIGHILKVGAEYSPTSAMELTCSIPRDGYCDFQITTQGVNGAGLSDPEIFADTTVTEEMLTRPNSGVYFCRMMRVLLTSRIIPDKSYTEGARYTLRVRCGY